MRTITYTIFVMGVLSFFLGCSKQSNREGGLYYTSDDKGGYSVLKILKLDEKGVHVRLYSNRFNEPPKHIDESKLYMAGMNRKPDEALGMGHIPLSKASFDSWNAVFVQQSTVTDDELEGYRIWQQGGGYW